MINLVTLKEEIKSAPREKLVEYLEKCASLIAQMNYENTGVMFVSGVSETPSPGKMPEKITICPSYGADVTYIYQLVP